MGIVDPREEAAKHRAEQRKRKQRQRQKMGQQQQQQQQGGPGGQDCNVQ